MKTYTVLFAEDVPHYGTAEIKARNDAAALEAAKDYDLSEVTTDPEWENSVCKRIIHIEGPEGNVFATDVPLDNCFLRYGGEKERLLCEAARSLLDAAQLALRELREFYLDSDSQAILELKAAEKVVNRWEKGDLAEAVRELAAAIATAKGRATP